MEVSEIFGIGPVAAILLAIFGMGLVVIRHIDLRSYQLEDSVKSAGTRISDDEREQARREGENRILERLAHGHERGDQSAD